VVVAALVAAPAASATGGGSPAGAAFTTINSAVDGGGVGPREGLCYNGRGNVNCNRYYNKRFVWINGGPDRNKLTDGRYFFAVLEPGWQLDPNDQVPVSTTDKNLSDDHDTWENRTFTVKNGNIFSYTPAPGQTPHDFAVDTKDANEPKIRLFPYSDTTNRGGVYILAICYLGPVGAQAATGGGGSGGGHPGTHAKNCKYDAFKVKEDTTPPSCPPPTFGVDKDGHRYGKQLFWDEGGIDYIEVVSVVNMSIAPLGPGLNYFQGTTDVVQLTGTEINYGKGANIRILVRDVGGNVVECDPVMTTVRAGSRATAGRGLAETYRVSRRETTVTIQNGRPGLARLVVTVNGRRFVARNLRAGERRKLNIASALVRGGHRNRVTLQGTGRRGAQAFVAISN
jgi:hypothetical protein